MFQVAISVVISRVFGAIFAQVLDPKATTFSLVLSGVCIR